MHAVVKTNTPHTCFTILLLQSSSYSSSSAAGGGLRYIPVFKNSSTVINGNIFFVVTMISYYQVIFIN